MTTTLKDLYEGGADMMSAGTEFEYRGYILEQASTARGTELKVVNPNGRGGKRRKVESLSPAAFDTYAEFESKVNEIVDYDPEDLDDWLSR